MLKEEEKKSARHTINNENHVAMSHVEGFSLAPEKLSADVRFSDLRTESKHARRMSGSVGLYHLIVLPRVHYSWAHMQHDE